MRRILVPVDFSTTSKKAFRFAVDIAAKTEGIIILIHFFTPVKKGVFDSRKSVEKKTKTLQNNAQKRLERLKKKVVEGFGPDVVVTTIIRSTPVVNSILEFAKQNHIDMIVMGTQGAGGLKKVIVGSVAAKIITEAEIPVILIPEKFGMKKIEQIVFTTDTKRTERKALPIVFDFAGIHDARVTVLNLYLKMNGKEKSENKHFENYTNEVKKAYNNSPLNFKQIETRSISKTMENLLKEVSFDLLAMARRKLPPKDRLFQKSFTKEMAFMTTQPLMVVPEEADF
jgi:nucleotide-binding universal stress UspA family protein